MSCHSQIAPTDPALRPSETVGTQAQPIQWNRVNDLPDFVYFDHHIHVNKGVGCETCHGRVDTMIARHVKANTFYMAWCLSATATQPNTFVRWTGL